MIPKILKTVFIVLGLAMIWVGFLSNYKLSEQQIKEESPSPAPTSTQLETYTLSNDAYSEEAIEELKFNNPGNGETSLIYQLGEFPESEDDTLDYINTAGFADEFDEFKAQETEVIAENEEVPFPMVFIFGGIGFLLIGFFAIRSEV